MGADDRSFETVGATLLVLVILVAGCNTLGTNDGDVVIRNEDDREHSVTIILDRGDAYPTPNSSVSVEPESQHRIAGFLPASDWPYPLFLHVKLDDKHVKRTGHRWEDEIELVIRGNSTVESPDPSTVVGLTPALSHNESK